MMQSGVPVDFLTLNRVSTRALYSGELNESTGDASFENPAISSTARATSFIRLFEPFDIRASAARQARNGWYFCVRRVMRTTLPFQNFKRKRGERG